MFGWKKDHGYDLSEEDFREFMVALACCETNHYLYTKNIYISSPTIYFNLKDAIREAIIYLEHYSKHLKKWADSLISAEKRLELLSDQFSRACKMDDKAEAQKIYAEISKVIDDLSGKCERCGK